MEFMIAPYPHQLDILEKSKKEPHLALLWEMGAGKTFGVINILRQKYYEARTIQRTVIFTPQVTMFNWKEEFKKFSKIPENKIWVLNQSGKKRVDTARAILGDHSKNLNKNAILIVNWEALLNDDLFDILCEWRPQILVGDELHLIKNYKAKRSKRAVELADICRKNIGHVYGLTGTAILNSVEDIYMQYRFLDGGQRFGVNYFTFRNRYMIDENARWAGRSGYFPKWGPRPEMYQELNEKIYSCATRVTKEECMKHLPPLIKTRRYVPLSPQQKRMYKQMKEEFITYVDEKKAEGHSPAVVANLAVTKSMRMLQILTGFATDEDGIEHAIKGNPRLEHTKELLEEITPSNKVILWCSFRYNYKQLAKLCKKLNLDYRMLTGQMTAADKQKSMIDFQEDDKVRVMIANRRAGGIGVNLTAAAYSVVYSRNFSLGEERQSEARNHRGGSEIHEKIIKIDLLAENTIDELVLAVLEGKQDLSNAIIDWGK